MRRPTAIIAILSPYASDACITAVGIVGGFSCTFLPTIAAVADAATMKYLAGGERATRSPNQSNGSPKRTLAKLTARIHFPPCWRKIPSPARAARRLTVPSAFGVHSTRPRPRAHTATIARKFEQDPHWVKMLDHAKVGFEAASVWPARCRSMPGASFICCSTNHHLSVKATDANPLPMRMAPRNGS